MPDSRPTAKNATPARVLLTVTNDLSYDQRMIRICTSLANAGYEVCLVGRKLPESRPLAERPYEQRRLWCFFRKGKLFYLEYNLRLFFFLLFARYTAVCSVDLDTILAGFWASRLRRKVCVYDAHEYFTELPEVVLRPRVQRIWAWVGRHTVPKLRYAYTVCESLAGVFRELYKIDFEVIRNVPFGLPPMEQRPARRPDAPFVLLYQGMLNDGRGLEEMIAAMRLLDGVELWLAGEGDCSEQLRAQVQASGLSERVRFLGYRMPEELKQFTAQCDLGINLLQNKGLNYYYSLANKFFDYIQSEKPSLNMDFPEYRALNDRYQVGALCADLSPETLAAAVRSLRDDPARYAELCANCRHAKTELNWEREEQKLLGLYQKILATK